MPSQKPYTWEDFSEEQRADFIDALESGASLPKLGSLIGVGTNTSRRLAADLGLKTLSSRKDVIRGSWKHDVRLDLTQPDQAYFYGFALCDGSMSESTRNRGKLHIEISYIDHELLLRFQRMFPDISSIRTRERETNFSNGKSKTATLTVSNHSFRQQLKTYGFPVGKKSKIIQPPDGAYDQTAFWRGIIDADGSIGFAPSLGKSGSHFISLCTSSYELAKAFDAFVASRFSQKPRTVRLNDRDSAVNLMYANNRAFDIVSLLYGEKDCLALHRKHMKAKAVIADGRSANAALETA